MGPDIFIFDDIANTVANASDHLYKASRPSHLVKGDTEFNFLNPQFFMRWKIPFLKSLKGKFAIQAKIWRNIQFCSCVASW